MAPVLPPKVKPALIITFPKRASGQTQPIHAPSLLLVRARHSLMQHAWADAEKHLRLVLHTEPTHTEALNLLGVLQLCRSETGPALETFEAVLAQRPRNVCALV